MWRTIGKGPDSGASPAKSPSNVEQPQLSENWPTPGELAFESGIIIAGALTVALVIQVMLAAYGIYPV